MDKVFEVINYMTNVFMLVREQVKIYKSKGANIEENKIGPDVDTLVFTKNPDQINNTDEQIQTFNLKIMIPSEYAYCFLNIN